jgi:hypothetical protein
LDDAALLGVLAIGREQVIPALGVVTRRLGRSYEILVISLLT